MVQKRRKSQNRAISQRSIRASTNSPKQRQSRKNNAETTKRSLEDMEREADRLLRVSEEERNSGWRKDADNVWGFIKEMAGDIYQGAHSVMEDLGVNPADLLALL